MDCQLFFPLISNFFRVESTWNSKTKSLISDCLKNKKVWKSKKSLKWAPMLYSKYALPSVKVSWSPRKFGNNKNWIWIVTLFLSPPVFIYSVSECAHKISAVYSFLFCQGVWHIGRHKSEYRIFSYQMLTSSRFYTKNMPI